MIKKILLTVLIVFTVFIAYIASRMYISEPDYDVSEYVNKDRTVVDSTFFKLENNWLRKNKKGLCTTLCVVHKPNMLLKSA